MDNRAGYSKTPKMEQVRTRIKEATFDLIIERGFSGTFMTDIAQAVGIGRRTLYRYFPNVDEIAAEIYTDLAKGEGMGDQLDWPAGLNAFQKLEAICMQFYQYSIANERKVRFIVEYDYHFTDIEQLRNLKLINLRPNRIKDILRQGIEDKSLSVNSSDIDKVAATIPNAIAALSLRIIYREEVYKVEYGYDRYDTKCLIDLILNGLRPQQAPNSKRRTAKH
jgi:AcrR family transcriptional regulator